MHIRFLDMAGAYLNSISVAESEVHWLGLFYDQIYEDCVLWIYVFILTMDLCKNTAVFNGTLFRIIYFFRDDF